MSHSADFKTALDALCQHYGTHLSDQQILDGLAETLGSRLAFPRAVDLRHFVDPNYRQEFERRVEADRKAGRLPF